MLTAEQISRGTAKLNEYNLRRGKCYKNQEVALRDSVRRITGMSVRDFRRYLREAHG